MISKSTIDKVFDQLRVEEVIGDFIQLKKSGANFKGLSPFSNEKTPSLMVSPTKQIWKDFSSGKGGNAVTFLMEHEHFTYPEAIRYLANKYHIEIEETQASEQEKIQANERESLYIVTQFAQQFFEKTLHETEKGLAIGKTYFKERGFTDDTIKKFQLGYSPDQWSAFTDEALKKGYQLEFLEKTGLTIVKDDKKFDRFKGRVIFPILSMSGRILGFGGRILTSDKNTAKYLNSPESDIYHKSQILYGIYHAKQAIAKADSCYLVEGYTDVIQFHQRGVENVVSSSGTALTTEQIRLISRLTNNITLLFDGDEAGIRATIRGVDLILQQGMNVKICTFPNGEDPDSFARKNAHEDLIAFLKENTVDFIQFKASMLIKAAKNDPIERANVIQDMVQSISKISDPIKTQIYVQECSKIMEIPEEVLFSALAQKINKEYLNSKKKANQPQKIQVEHPEQQQNNLQTDRYNILEQDLIKIMIRYGNKVCNFEETILTPTDNDTTKEEKIIQQARVFEKIAFELQQDEIEFTNPFFKEMYLFLLKKFQNQEDFQISDLSKELPIEFSQKLSDIAFEDDRHQLDDWQRYNIEVKTIEEGVERAITDIILNIRVELVNKIINDLKSKINELPDEEKDKAIGKIMDYMSLKQLLFDKLKRVIN